MFVELSAEQIKGGRKDLLDLYHVKVKNDGWNVSKDTLSQPSTYSITPSDGTVKALYQEEWQYDIR